ncbi:MAG: hypothetical protein QQN41_07430 [Nitrosopumilus sp.]
MSASFFVCLFGDCPACNNVNYSEFSFFKKHLKQKHDYLELFDKANSIGLLDDLSRFYPVNILVEKLTSFASKEK